VLQIDHDERGARRLEIGKTVFAATACDDPLYDLVGNGGAVEFLAPLLADMESLSPLRPEYT